MGSFCDTSFQIDILFPSCSSSILVNIPRHSCPSLLHSLSQGSKTNRWKVSQTSTESLPESLPETFRKFTGNFPKVYRKVYRKNRNLHTSRRFGKKQTETKFTGKFHMSPKITFGALDRSNIITFGALDRSNILGFGGLSRSRPRSVFSC